MAGYILLFGSIVLAIIGQILLKTGVGQHELAMSPKLVVQIMTSKYLFFGFFCYGLGSLLWLSVLKRFPLSVAYPALSISYVIIVFVSAYFFHEPITLKKLIGITAIMIGVVVLFT